MNAPAGQSSFEFDLPPAARRSDPGTSHAAAEAVTRAGIRGGHCAAVLTAIRQWPGLTSRELAKRMRWDRHEVARRCADLKGNPERGVPALAAQGKQRTCSVSHKAAITWWPVEAAK